MAKIANKVIKENGFPVLKYRWIQKRLGKIRKYGTEEQKAFLRNNSKRFNLRSKHEILLEAWEKMPVKF